MIAHRYREKKEEDQNSIWNSMSSYIDSRDYHAEDNQQCQNHYLIIKVNKD